MLAIGAVPSDPLFMTRATWPRGMPGWKVGAKAGVAKAEASGRPVTPALRYCATSATAPSLHRSRLLDSRQYPALRRACRSTSPASAEKVAGGSSSVRSVRHPRPSSRCSLISIRPYPSWWKSSVTSRNRRGGHVAPATAASAAVGWLCSFCRCLLRCVMQVSLPHSARTSSQCRFALFSPMLPAGAIGTTCVGSTAPCPCPPAPASSTGALRFGSATDAAALPLGNTCACMLLMKSSGPLCSPCSRLRRPPSASLQASLLSEWAAGATLAATARSAIATSTATTGRGLVAIASLYSQISLTLLSSVPG
mmetsp:Transcript_31678/g.81166  ORF Transcript_31678/g.81166 Transcript_31678/m.81166 type:complete len:309 (+) Transcript_31678:1212-2138(+)